MPDIPGLFDGDLVGVLGKAGVLILLVLYLIFSFIVFLQVRSLNTIVRIKIANSTTIIPLFFLIHLILILSLFFLTLVIL
jgi:hypothetical protein